MSGGKKLKKLLLLSLSGYKVKGLGSEPRPFGTGLDSSESRDLHAILQTPLQISTAFRYLAPNGYTNGRALIKRRLRLFAKPYMAQPFRAGLRERKTSFRTDVGGARPRCMELRVLDNRPCGI